MKLKTIVDPTREEDEVVIYARERTRQIMRIEDAVRESEEGIVGYGEDGSIVPLAVGDVTAFVVEKGRVFALVGDERLRLRERLCTIEKRLSSDFVKINQSCIGNLRKITRFYSSVGGSLRVVFGNGYCDYVSRRQLKVIKERLK